MSTHLFAGETVSAVGTISVTSQITICCHQHVFGLPSGDLGTIDPEAVDCPALSRPSVAAVETPKENTK